MMLSNWKDTFLCYFISSQDVEFVADLRLLINVLVLWIFFFFLFKVFILNFFLLSCNSCRKFFIVLIFTAREACVTISTVYFVSLLSVNFVKVEVTLLFFLSSLFSHNF